MGKKDKATKIFFSDRENFLSVINFYYGWDVAQENDDSLSERLFAVVEVFDAMDKMGKRGLAILEKERDVVKRIRHGDKRLIMGLENQQGMDFSEPVRVMLYDSMEYERQRRVIQYIHKKKQDLQGDEYVAGFGGNDFVVPVHTLVIYYGKEPWERPRRLSDILENTGDISIEVQDYRIDVLDVRRLTDEQIDSIDSDVRLLFGCVKYDEDPDKMDEFVEKNREHFESMLPDTYFVIATMTDSLILQEKMEQWKDEGERLNMCEAFEAWKREAERIGLENGMQQGMQQGIVKSGKELGATKEKVMELLKKNLSLNETECMKCIEMYW